jgi:hypothetical protein
MLIGIEEAKVLTAGCLSEGFLGLWCHIVADPAGGFHRLVVGVLGLWDLHLRQGWWWLVGVGLVVGLFKQRLLPLFLLVKDIDGVLELRKSFSFSIDMLPSSFGTLRCCLSFGDSFLFLSEPFDFLLNSN